MKVLLKTAQCLGILGVFLHSFAMPVYAAEQQRPPRDDHQFGPPQETLLACKGLTENDACAFAGHNDELISGVCSLPPPRAQDTSTLACRPDRMPGNPNMEPPPERED